MRTLDQARNIGEHEFAPVDPHHAELRNERGERVIGDFRLRGADRGQKCGFSRIGQAHETGVGDEFEPQENRALLARLPGIGAARRAVGRGFEMRIAETAVAAPGERRAVADLDEIGKKRLAVRVEDLGPGRHFEHEVGAAGARALLAHAVLPAAGLEMLAVAIVDQRVEARHGLRHHVAAAAAVTAPGAAELDEFLAPERHAAVAAVAGPDLDFCLVEKFHGVGFGDRFIDWSLPFRATGLQSAPSPLEGEGWGGGYLNPYVRSTFELAPPSRLAREARNPTSPSRGAVYGASWESLIYATRREAPQLLSEAQIERSSRKRSIGAELFSARMR